MEYEELIQQDFLGKLIIVIAINVPFEWVGTHSQHEMESIFLLFKPSGWRAASYSREKKGWVHLKYQRAYFVP